MIFLVAFPLAKFVNGSDMFPSGHRAHLLVPVSEQRVQNVTVAVARGQAPPELPCSFTLRVGAPCEELIARGQAPGHI